MDKVQKPTNSEEIECFLPLLQFVISIAACNVYYLYEIYANFCILVHLNEIYKVY
jgi:hypothetical protein